MVVPPPRSTLFPYTTLFRSTCSDKRRTLRTARLTRSARTVSMLPSRGRTDVRPQPVSPGDSPYPRQPGGRSEEHTSELQSLRHLVCRLLHEKKNQNITLTM